MLDRLLSSMGLKSRLEALMAALLMFVVLTLAWEWLIKPFNDLANRNNEAIGSTLESRK